MVQVGGVFHLGTDTGIEIEGEVDIFQDSEVVPHGKNVRRSSLSQELLILVVINRGTTAIGIDDVVFRVVVGHFGVTR